MANEKLQMYLKDKFVNISALSRAMGATRQSLTNKVNGKANFTQGDLMLLREHLHLTDEEFMDIFFDRGDEKLSTKESS